MNSFNVSFKIRVFEKLLPDFTNSLPTLRTNIPPSVMNSFNVSFKIRVFEKLLPTLAANMFPVLLMNLTHMLCKVLIPLQADCALGLHVHVYSTVVGSQFCFGPEHCITSFNFTQICFLNIIGMFPLYVTLHIFN